MATIEQALTGTVGLAQMGVLLEQSQRQINELRQESIDCVKGMYLEKYQRVQGSAILLLIKNSSDRILKSKAYYFFNCEIFKYAPPVLIQVGQIYCAVLATIDQFRPSSGLFLLSNGQVDIAIIFRHTGSIRGHTVYCGIRQLDYWTREKLAVVFSSMIERKSMCVSEYSDALATASIGTTIAPIAEFIVDTVSHIVDPPQAMPTTTDAATGGPNPDAKRDRKAGGNQDSKRHMKDPTFPRVPDSPQKPRKTPVDKPQQHMFVAPSEQL